MHRSPKIINQLAVLTNNLVELILPFILFFPWRKLRQIAAGCMILFMISVAISGNLAWLNHLTIIPAICAFDDQSLAWLFSAREIQNARLAQKVVKRKKYQKLCEAVLFCLIAKLSIPVTINLIGSNKIMESSFAQFRLVNNYLTFSYLLRHRTELIFKVMDEQDNYTELQFHCKPGLVDKRPCFI